MAPAATRVIGYTRSSTEEQTLTHDAQEAIIRRVAAQRDWVIVDIVHDVGVSGAAKVMPGREEAIARIEAGEADALVVTKLDRLSRSIVDFGAVAERARDLKWALVVLDPEVDMTTSSGELMANVLISFAQFERRLISERTKAGMQAAKAKGSKAGKPTTVTPKLRARIKALHEAGMGYNAIAKKLNAEGVPTPMGATMWRHPTVSKIVNSEDR
jgi:DNA invertase Pin-like site-specific DNA recombinase